MKPAGALVPESKFKYFVGLPSIALATPSDPGLLADEAIIGSPGCVTSLCACALKNPPRRTDRTTVPTLAFRSLNIKHRCCVDVASLELAKLLSELRSKCQEISQNYCGFALRLEIRAPVESIVISATFGGTSVVVDLPPGQRIPICVGNSGPPRT